MKKITNIKKSKDGHYSVEVDGLEIILSEDVLINYLLKTDKTLSDSEYDDLIKTNDYYLELSRLKKVLVKKRMLESEVLKIIKAGVDQEEIIDELKQFKLIDDSNYIRSFIHDKMLFNKTGKQKICQMLLKKGANKDQLMEIMDEVDDDVEIINVEKQINLELKKTQIMPKNTYLGKLKIKLLNRGYQSRIIDKVLGDNYSILLENVDEETSIKKEFLKLKKKYNSSQFAQKLYQKGYSKEIIQKILNDDEAF